MDPLPLPSLSKTFFTGRATLRSLRDINGRRGGRTQIHHQTLLRNAEGGR